MITRPRRLRQNPVLRKMVRETRMDASSLIYPMFVREGSGIKEEIPAMEGQYRYTTDTMLYALEDLEKAGVRSVMFFGIPDVKDEVGSGAYAEDGIVQRALREARAHFPEMYLITDVCMCEYTSHGHCGLLKGHDVDNDSTLELLAKTAVSHVQAGGGIVTPARLNGGRGAAIRNELGEDGFGNKTILFIAGKKAVLFFGTILGWAGFATAIWDRKSYQMDFHNRKEALKEAQLDVAEGADIIMVKPAMTYLDIVREVADTVNVPVAAYSVSGEYAMVKAGAKLGCVDEEKIVCEMATGVYRAGACVYLTYFAKEIAGYIEKGYIG